MFRFLFPPPLCISRYKKAKTFAVSRSSKKIPTIFLLTFEKIEFLYLFRNVYIYILFFFFLNIEKIITPVFSMQKSWGKFPGQTENFNGSIRSLLFVNRPTSKREMSASRNSNYSRIRRLFPRRKKVKFGGNAVKNRSFLPNLTGNSTTKRVTSKFEFLLNLKERELIL